MEANLVVVVAEAALVEMLRQEEYPAAHLACLGRRRRRIQLH